MRDVYAAAPTSSIVVPSHFAEWEKARGQLEKVVRTLMSLDTMPEGVNYSLWDMSRAFLDAFHSRETATEAFVRFYCHNHDGYIPEGVVEVMERRLTALQEARPTKETDT